MLLVKVHNTETAALTCDDGHFLCAGGKLFGMMIPRQFSLGTLLEVIAVAAFICTILLVRTPSANSHGRYQMWAYPNGGQMLIFDTQTGKSWFHDPARRSIPASRNIFAPPLHHPLTIRCYKLAARRGIMLNPGPPGIRPAGFLLVTPPLCKADRV